VAGSSDFIQFRVKAAYYFKLRIAHRYQSVRDMCLNFFIQNIGPVVWQLILPYLHYYMFFLGVCQGFLAKCLSEDAEYDKNRAAVNDPLLFFEFIQTYTSCTILLTF